MREKGGKACEIFAVWEVICQGRWGGSIWAVPGYVGCGRSSSWNCCIEELILDTTINCTLRMRDDGRHGAAEETGWSHGWKGRMKRGWKLFKRVQLEQASVWLLTLLNAVKESKLWGHEQLCACALGIGGDVWLSCTSCHILMVWLWGLCWVG
jgi:hypothetical protein